MVCLPPCLSFTNPISWNANIENLNRPSTYRPNATSTPSDEFDGNSEPNDVAQLRADTLTSYRKDKTLVEILERLKSLEGGLRNLDGKVDSLNSRGTLPLSIYGPIQSNPPATLDASQSSSWPAANVHLQPSAIPPASPRDVQYVSATHKMLSWPFIQQVLETKVPNLDLANLEKDGAAMLLGLQGRTTSLPTDMYDSPNVSNEGGSIPLQVSSASQVEGMQLGGPSMNWETMQRLTKSYFDTFNLIYPIMDRQVFQSEVLPTIASHGFDESSSSTLTCLVFALGEVAMGAVQGAPIGVSLDSSIFLPFTFSTSATSFFVCILC